MVTNPCGLSHEEILKAIKESVLNTSYKDRGDLKKKLLKLGYSFSEVNQITSTYFNLYRKLSKEVIRSNFNNLSAEQKTKEKMIDLSVKYLNGTINEFPITEAEESELRKIYDKADKALTPSLKQKYNDEADVFLRKMLPSYGSEIIKSAIYNLPLFSINFTTKAITSNLFGMIENKIQNIWDGKKADFTNLNKFNEMGQVAAWNVLHGGIPATSLYQEVSKTHYGGRLYEYDLEGTDIDTKLGRKYYGLMNWYSKWSSRFNSTVDTYGIYHNAERHFYELLKQKYRSETDLNEKEIQQKVLQDMELSDTENAKKLVEANFKEIGEKVYNNTGDYTPEFQLAVQEYVRKNRNEETWQKALDLAKNDFWKKNMTIKSELGFGDTGIFGLKARTLNAIKKTFTPKGGETKLSAALNMSLFGFVNGASNFAEDAIERFPLYATVKALALQYKKGQLKANLSPQELIEDASRLQRKLLVKNVTTFAYFVMARLIEHQFCPDKENKQSVKEISSSFTTVGICGKPITIPPQMMVMYKVYKILEMTAKNDDDYFDAALNMMPIMVQSNEMGIGGSVDKMVDNTVDMVKNKSYNNEVGFNEYRNKVVNEIIKSGIGVANSYLPIPSRLLGEVGSYTQRIEGKGQQLQPLPFAIDETGEYMGTWKTAGKVSVAALGNVTGINEMLLATISSNKTYSTDWQGRTVAKFRGGDILGNGIQYNANDDILATANVKPPYLSRMEKVKVSEGKEYAEGLFNNPLVEKKEKVRYMTDEEYYNASLALGNFNKKFFENERQQSDIIQKIKSDKINAQKQLQAMFTSTQKLAVEAITIGIKDVEDIERYIEDNWNSQKKKVYSEKSYK